MYLHYLENINKAYKGFVSGPIVYLTHLWVFSGITAAWSLGTSNSLLQQWNTNEALSVLLWHTKQGDVSALKESNSSKRSFQVTSRNLNFELSEEET